MTNNGSHMHPSPSDIWAQPDSSRDSNGSRSRRRSVDYVADVSRDETGPLLQSPPSGAASGRPVSSRGTSSVFAADHVNRNEESKSTAYLFLLTAGMLGLQMGWSVEMAGGSPFLLSLGMSKALLAFVWLAGPLSGVLVQPYVGIRSDNCRIQWGRRKPFMIGGAAATILSLLALCWTREIVATFLGIFGIDLWGQLTSPAFQVFAVIAIYVLDFAINVIQGSIRAFIIDCSPTHQQETANAWAARLSGVGHILAYIIGFVYLPDILPFLGNTQLKVFVSITCLAMAATTAISCLSVTEPDPRLLGPPPDDGGGVISFFRALYRSARTLPRQVKMVCLVQIFAWIGWFPFLFYTTTYIGQLYVEPFFAENPNMTEQEIDDVWEKGTRIGTFGLLVYAVTTFVSSVFLPMIIPPTYQPVVDADVESTLLGEHPAIPNSPTLDDNFSPAPFAKTSASSVHRFGRFCDLTVLQIPCLTLRRAWLLSHLAFTVLMWLTFFVSTPVGGIILIGLVGIPWSVTTWAPFALIAAEISRRNAARRGYRPPAVMPSATITHEPLSSSADLDYSRPDSASHQRHVEEDGESADQAGVLLGIHNVAISAPQVIATLVSSAMFHALQKPRGTPGDDSVGWVLRMGGLCALGAAWCTRYVRDGIETR